MSEVQAQARPSDWQARSINAAFESTGVKFSSPNVDVLAKFNREVSFDENDQPFAVYDQAILSLKDALTRFAYDSEGLCDRRTLPRSGAGTGRPGADSKSAYQTVAQKVAYISEFGDEAWAKLPMTNSTGNEILHREDWHGLPTAEKVRRLNLDPDAYNKLQRRPSDSPRNTFINHEYLAKQKIISPSRYNRRSGQ